MESRVKINRIFKNKLLAFSISALSLLAPNAYEGAGLAAPGLSKITTPCLEAPSKSCATATESSKKKDWTFLVYIAAQNNLSRFVDLNINQMVSVGQTANHNVLLQVDREGENTIKRMKLDGKTLKTIEELKPTQETISGTPESLFECAKWGTKEAPSKNLALIIWNHGSGYLDPQIWRNFSEQKGIAFNDKYHTYITSPQLESTLNKINKELLGGKKIAILGFDACLMAGAEITSLAKESSQYLVASEEVAPGRGWNYELMLKGFAENKTTPEQFSAKTISQMLVKEYQKEYEETHPKFTLSAIDLSGITAAEAAIEKLVAKMVSTIKGKKGKELSKLIKAIRSSRKLTTTFHDTNYIDLFHFIQSLKGGLAKVSKHFEKQVISDLENLTSAAEKALVLTVVGKTSAEFLPKAQGLSVYFPALKIKSDYQDSSFAKKTMWHKMLSEVLGTQRSADSSVDED
jgi:hypothetical protein